MAEMLIGVGCSQSHGRAPHQLNEIAVSRRETLRGVTRFLWPRVLCARKPFDTNKIEGAMSEQDGVCDNQFATARKLLILKRPAVSERSESNGEMSEWFKEHAWKTNRATLID
jgi:hypothetical protein